VKPLIVDTLASGKGTRYSTKDVIGAGPRTIAGVLEKRELDPAIISVESYLCNKYDPEIYDILLVSGMTSDMQAVQRTVRKWKKYNKGPVVIGGPVSSEPTRALKRTGGDIAVTGEGEITLVELLNGGLLEGKLPECLNDILGISYKSNNKIIVNPFRPVQPREVFTDFIPSTNIITAYKLYNSARVYVETVRGCSNFHRARIGTLGEKCSYCEQCTESELIDRYDCPVGIPPGCGYCSVPSLYGPPKSRPSWLIIDEVSQLLDLGVHRVVLSAPGFLDYQRDILVEPLPLTDPKLPEPNYDEIEVLLKGLTDLPQVKNGNASIMIENIKASLVSKRAAGLLGKYLSGTTVSIGFETGSATHSKVLGRPDTPSEALISLRRLKDAGMKPYVYFIHGLPGQTAETVKETVNTIKQSRSYGADRVILYRFQSLPASAFEECPSGPPASRDLLSRRIHDAAYEANLKSKEALVGAFIKVVIAERYSRDRRFYVAYPMFHGPVTLIHHDNLSPGDIVKVRVTGIASDRIVYGQIIN
jgi:radical SAM superfamily enzyme YgiQ (UPF0313 family)